MNTLNVLYRDTTCAAGALVITFLMGLSFVQSTAVAPARAPPRSRPYPCRQTPVGSGSRSRPFW